MRGLEGKVVVVAAGGTGASDGTSHGASLGGATARRLAAEGAAVVVGDLDEAAAARTVASILDAGGTAVAHRFDVSDEASVEGLVARAVREYGAVDGVHANAMDMSRAILGVDGESDLCTLPLDVWQRTLDVGLTGFLLVARHAIPRLLERGGGGIVATVSGAIYAGEPVRVGYAAAKTGITAVVRHIASRWGREGVRANAVAPGIVYPEGADDTWPPEAIERALRIGRSHRIGRPDDIAAMVAFLLSDDGAWVNGQIVSVDGGTALGR